MAFDREDNDFSVRPENNGRPPTHDARERQLFTYDLNAEQLSALESRTLTDDPDHVDPYASDRRNGPYEKESEEDKKNRILLQHVIWRQQYNAAYLAMTDQFIFDLEEMLVNKDKIAQEVKEGEEKLQEIKEEADKLEEKTVEQATEWLEANSAYTDAKNNLTDSQGRKVIILGEDTNNPEFVLADESGKPLTGADGNTVKLEGAEKTRLTETFRNEIVPLRQLTEEKFTAARQTEIKSEQVQQTLAVKSEEVVAKREKLNMLEKHGVTREQIREMKENRKLLQEGKIDRQEFESRIPENARRMFEERKADMHAKLQERGMSQEQIAEIDKQKDLMIEGKISREEFRNSLPEVAREVMRDFRRESGFKRSGISASSEMEGTNGHLSARFDQAANPEPQAPDATPGMQLDQTKAPIVQAPRM